MSRPRPYGVPKWHYGWRRNLILTGCVLLAIAVSGALWWSYPRFTDDPAPKATKSAPASTSPSYGIPPYGPDPSREPTQEEIEARAANETAISAKRQYPKLYNDACRAYPADAQLHVRDLIPTVNVPIVFTYNNAKKKYVAAADKRVEIRERFVTRTGESGESYTAQQFSWSYTVPAELYGGTEYRLNGNNDGMIWGTEFVANNGMGVYSMLLHPTRGQDYPIFLALAGDGTCTPSSVRLPSQAGKMFTQLSRSGLLLPQGAN